MLEKALIMHCSPTLAGLKSANIVNYTYETLDGLHSDLAECKRKLEPKGVSLRLLKIADTKALVYVYRRSRIQEDLKKKMYLTSFQNMAMKQTVSTIVSTDSQTVYQPNQIFLMRLVCFSAIL